ncbi:MAG: T9SS type A sorting domain-containing protein [Bacteroidota bacterium]|nr:T9SS type A sorting domain-containing protein [Bacteroidota bacterium]
MLSLISKITCPFLVLLLLLSTQALLSQSNGGFEDVATSDGPLTFDWMYPVAYIPTMTLSECNVPDMMRSTASLTDPDSSNVAIRIYPNPVKSGDMLMVEYGREITASAMQIIDASGKVASTKYNVPCKGGVSGMLTDGLLPGIYTLLIDEQYHARFVITR